MTKYDSVLISDGYDDGVVDLTFARGMSEKTITIKKNAQDIIKQCKKHDITHGNQICLGSWFDCDNPELVAAIYRGLR